MRQKIVLLLLAGMLAASAFLLVTRERRASLPEVTASGAAAGDKADQEAGKTADQEAGKTAETPGKAAGDPGPDKGKDKDPGAQATPGATGDGAATSRTGEEAADKAVARPIRVVAMGWDQLVPGIMASGGVASAADSEFARQGVETRFHAVQSMREVEAALARGGDVDGGADVAIVPLPAVVASYEDLRALAPQVFFVIGWSRGRDALTGIQARNLADVPQRKDVLLVGQAGDTATLLALFMLDQAGVPLSQVKLIAPGDAARSSAHLAAVDRSQGGDAKGSRRVLVTTADATDLIPYVAITPGGFLQAHGQELTGWARAWLGGVERMRVDMPGAARIVAALPGAPEPVVLLRQLGQIEFASLGENARLAGLSGRGAVTVAVLFQATWTLWRGIGVLSTPAPESAPLSTQVITALVRTSATRPADRSQVKPSFQAAPIVRIVLAGKRDEAEIVDRLGLAAGVFSRSALRVGVDRNKKRTQALIEQAVERFDLVDARIDPAHDLGKGRGAVIEVLAAP
jgi:hypothetical protein